MASDLPPELNINSIRSSLIRQEETIIFALIERAQFLRNEAITTPGHPAFSKVLTASAQTFLDHMLLEHERVDARVRRYTSPEEYSFFPNLLPAPALERDGAESVLFPSAINVNDQIKALYLNTILPTICRAGDDGQYGSAALCDINVLQAISKRVHFGKFVAESKFRSEEGYEPLIQDQDWDGLMAKLTKPSIEERLLRRVYAKASTYGQDITDAPAAAPEGAPAREGPPSPIEFKVRPDVIRQFYDEHIIPLTKKVEVLYLLDRLTGSQVAYCGSASRRAACSHFGAGMTSPGPVSGPYERPACILVECSSVEAVISALRAGRARYGITPLFDAKGALDVPTFHAIATTGLRVCNDVVLAEESLVLAAQRGARSERITAVQGTLARLVPLEGWLRQVLPHLEVKLVADGVAVSPGPTVRRQCAALRRGAGWRLTPPRSAQGAVICSADEAEEAGLVEVDLGTPLPARHGKPARYIIISTVARAHRTGRVRAAALPPSAPRPA